MVGNTFVNFWRNHIFYKKKIFMTLYILYYLQVFGLSDVVLDLGMIVPSLAFTGFLMTEIS